MKLSTVLLSALFVAPAIIHSRDASAESYDDLDEGSSDRQRNRKGPDLDRDVREITKGTYAKTNVGGAIYLGNYRSYVRPGTTLGLAVGKDFINQERMSMAWEVMFFQGVHNGTYYEEQGAQGCYQVGNCVQGDLRTYTFGGTVEWSTYPHRRVGIGARAGAGLMLSPLLMDETYYANEVVAGAWNGYTSPVHEQPHPVVMGGPTIEYYTKLAHFSAGLDTDIFYAIGFDLGVSITGALKYTF